MRPVRPALGGFTLVELIIAIGLGLVLMLTALAGLRLASQTSTTATRLSLENSLMRGAFLRAHEELDFWRAYDDPDNTAGRPFRDAGEPFYPMRAAFPRATLPSTGNAIAATDEFDLGWDEDYRWPAADKRTWMRANLAEKYNGALAFGHYSAFWNTSPTLAIDSSVGRYSAGAIAVPHSWLANQYWGMQDCVGYYGFADYMPANALFCTSRPRTTAGSDREITSPGGMTLRLFKPGGQFEPGEGGTEVVKSLWRLTMPAAYAIPKPGASGHARWFKVGYEMGTNDSAVRDLRDNARVEQVLMPLRPAAWPQATFSIMRFIKTRRFVNLATIGFTSPVTAERVELSFTGFGTTLRGARQQRGPLGGWTDYDNATGPSLGANLDTSGVAGP